MIVYAIYNEGHRKIYIGQTSNLVQRLREHNNRHNPRHRFTKQFNGEWFVIYQEEVQTRKDALRREKQLKSYRGRQFIKSIIPR